MFTALWPCSMAIKLSVIPGNHPLNWINMGPTVKTRLEKPSWLVVTETYLMLTPTLLFVAHFVAIMGCRLPTYSPKIPHWCS